MTNKNPTFQLSENRKDSVDAVEGFDISELEILQSWLGARLSHLQNILDVKENPTLHKYADFIYLELQIVGTVLNQKRDGGDNCGDGIPVQLNLEGV